MRPGGSTPDRVPRARTEPRRMTAAHRRARNLERRFDLNQWHYFTPISPADTPDDLISGDPLAIAFAGLWTNLESGRTASSYRLVIGGVQLRLAITGDEGTPGSLVATTPVGYRPEVTERWFCCIESGGIGAVDHNPDGTIVFVEAVTGPTGPAGPGAYTTTAANFTQPAVSSTVTVQVASTAWMVAGENLYIAGGGYYSVSSITDATHVVVTNLGYAGNAAATSTIGSGAGVAPAGLIGPAGSTGAAGAAGGPVSIAYTFSSTTTDSDPGNGVLRLSNSTQTSAITIRADLLDVNGTDWTNVLNTFADSTNTVKGHIRLFKASDPSKWLVFTVSAVATPTGYRNITVANVSGSSSTALTNGDAIILSFERAGDQGSSGGSPLTTKGDLFGYDTAGNRIPVGSDGKVLTADSTQSLGLKWATPSSGVGALLFDSTLGSAAASIDTGAGGIAGGYNVLEVWILAQTADAAALANIIVTVNNDTGSNYDIQYVQGNNVTTASDGAAAAARWAITLHGVGGTAGYPGLCRITIPGYAQTTFNKIGEMTSGTPDATASNRVAWHAILGYRSTTAISRMKVAAQSGANLNAGTRLLIFGR